MAAITTARPRIRVGALPPVSPLSLPLKGGIVIPAGACADKDASGYGTNGATNTTGKTAGIAQVTYDTTGLNDGDKWGDFHFGTWVFENSASTDQITVADVGNDCFLVDNNTVARTNGTNTRHVAGKVYAIETDGRVAVTLAPVP